MAGNPEFIVGIDLGTTNCAMATIPISESTRKGLRVDNSPIWQAVGVGETRELTLLPSFLYQTGGPELPEGSWNLPWNSEDPPLVGVFAREQGARVPGRLVSSAKSWLVHAGVNREGPILPWGAPIQIPKISPVDASRILLQHLVDTWNWSKKREGQNVRLQDQTIILTIPASFDDMARTLTIKAANSAGLKKVTLIEEPQAAFYCWMMEEGPDLGLLPGEVVVVVDVGGGTTDFTLIEAVEQQGEISLVRRAVGDHLLLGGDNMDMALAKALEPQMAGGSTRLDPVQFQQLAQQCRNAKELLLSGNSPDAVTVTIQGRGRSIVAGTVQARLSKDLVHQVIREGFFPWVRLGEGPSAGNQTGLKEFGLPYVGDAAVSRHLSAFLKNNGIGKNGPDAILFNGGVFQSEVLRARVLEQMNGWFPERKDKPIKVLATSSLDLAVARGAAHFGWIRHAGGRRIGGGIPRSYYVALGDADSNDQTSFLCVLPQKAEEGAEIAISSPVLSLAVGTPVRFQVFSSTARPGDLPGQQVRLNPGQLLALPPIQTLLRGGKRMGVRDVDVTLVSRVTELGTLELACAELGGSNKWVLEFNLRPLDGETLAVAQAETALGAGGVSGFPEETILQAYEAIDSVYQTGGLAKPGELVKTLESLLGATRGDWPLYLCRKLADKFISIADQRRKSSSHLARWLNLTGWCLRPGYGDVRDPIRVGMFWKALHAPLPGGTMRSGESGIDAWIMMRRVAGGLNENLQIALWDRIKMFLMPAKGRSVVKPPVNEVQEMWRCAASLERLDSATKIGMADILVRPLAHGIAQNHVYWCLGRLGGRWPSHGPWNTVVNPAKAEEWIDLLLPHVPESATDSHAWMLALAQLARRTEQRGLDISEGHRKSVMIGLNSAGAPAELLQMVESVVDVGKEQAGNILGDSLPLGLRLEQSGNA